MLNDKMEELQDRIRELENQINPPLVEVKLKNTGIY